MNRLTILNDKYGVSYEYSEEYESGGPNGGTRKIICEYCDEPRNPLDFNIIDIYIIDKLYTLDLSKYANCDKITVHSRNYNLVNNIIFPQHFKGKAKFRKNFIECYANAVDLTCHISDGRITGLNRQHELVRDSLPIYWLVFDKKLLPDLNGFVYLEELDEIVLSKKYVIVKDNLQIPDKFWKQYSHALVSSNSNRKIFRYLESSTDFTTVIAKIERNYQYEYETGEKVYCPHLRKIKRTYDGYRPIFKIMSQVKYKPYEKPLFGCPCHRDKINSITVGDQIEKCDLIGLSNVKHITIEADSCVQDQLYCDFTVFPALEKIEFSTDGSKNRELIDTHIVLEKYVPIKGIGYKSRFKVINLEIMCPGNEKITLDGDNCPHIWNITLGYSNGISYEQYRQIVDINIHTKNARKT